MSVMIETSLGEVVMDLFCEEAPLAAKNFLKLCKAKYYNGCLFYNVQQNFMIQAGDPTATGKGGTSVYGIMYGEQARFFEDEIRPTSRKHDEAGLVSMANMGVPDSNGSQFFFSMRGDDMQHLNGKHTVFAKVMEGMETLEEINSQFCDDNGRPYRDIRILHTYVLDDPFDDPPQLVVPDESPPRDRPDEERVPLRLGALDKVSLEADEQGELEREKQIREKTARSNAVVLEMIGDLPDADMKPPENVLFVCKLNPVTTDDDLEIIFTRFGTCRAEICRDHVTGDSLNYAFVEFEAVESCEEAFKKMNNVLIDDRRIRVDFSQSVAKEWSRYKGRAQGGQKLASGKGGKPTQQQPTAAGRHALPEPGQASGRGGANGNSDNKRRSKWGDAPGAGVAFPVPASDRTPARDEGRQGGASDREGKPNDSSKWSRSGGSRADGRERGHEHEAGDGDRRGQGRRTEVGQSRGGDVGSENHVGDSAREADRRDGQRREQGGSREAGSRNRGGRDAGRDHGSKNGTRRRDEDETERRDSRRKDDNRSYRSSTSGHRTDRGRGVEEEVSARSGGRKDGKDRDSHRGNDREHRSARKRSRSRSRDRGRGGGGGRDKDGRRY